MTEQTKVFHSEYNLVPLAGSTDDVIPEIDPVHLHDSVRTIRDAHFKVDSVHDPDFCFFRNLPESTIFCDIGANIGNTINTLTHLGSRAAVHAFEINLVLYGSIQEAMDIYPGLSKLYRFGLAEVEGSFWLYIPYCNSTFILGEASIRLEHLLSDGSLARLRSYTVDGDVAVGKVLVQVRPFDGLGICPDYVKIDVEGAEARVLTSMLSSIRVSLPIILVENSFQDEVDVMLGEIGYSPWAFDGTSQKLFRRPTYGHQNTFYVFEERIPALEMDGCLHVG
jgi:FkbM family methyltransferase